MSYSRFTSFTKSTFVFCMAISAISLIGCGRANMRLVEVNYPDGSQAQVIYNNDGTLQEIETLKQNGAFSQRLEFEWREGKLDNIQVLVDNAASFTLDYRYDDQGRLYSANADRDNQSMKIEYEYNNDNLLDQLDVSIDYGSGILNRQQAAYRFKEGKVSDIKNQNTATYPILGSSTTETNDQLDWDGNELRRITREGNGTDVFRFSYTNDGAIDEVDLGDDGYRLSYDNQGRMNEIEYQKNNGNREITEYSYEDGGSNGVQYTPAIPYGAFFDLAGRPFGTVEVNSLANLVAYFRL